MSLKKEVYQAFEDIVGSDYISDEPAILNSYRFHWLAEFLNPERKRITPVSAEAVLLPATVEEVQAIVKICNKYGVKMKPVGGGWGAWNAVLNEGAVQLDLKRMDRILDLDEKNMFAVVEPYVMGAELQAEAMKKGLNCHLIGAGGVCSVIATSACFLGASPNGMYMSHGPDNLLAVEWVSPTGEVVRTGSRGCGKGWFCSEGPGPSMRGVIRGHAGTLGSFGVVTKIGIKLHPWPGPAVYPITGKVPAYSTSLPGNFRAHTVQFPSEQAIADSLYKIYDARIGYVIHRQFNFYGDELQAAMIKIFSDSNLSLDNLEELLADSEVQKLTQEMKSAYQIVLAGNSIGDIEWQENALDEILAETGGKKVAALDTPFWEQFTLHFLLKLSTKNTNFLYTGSFLGIMGPVGSPDSIVPTIQPGVDINRKYMSQENSRIANTGANAFMGTLGYLGGGSSAYQEQFFFHDPADPTSVQQGLEVVGVAGAAVAQNKWPPSPYSGYFLTGFLPRPVQDMVYGMDPQPQAYVWQGQIREIFDPNNIGEKGYTYLEKKK